MASEQELCCIVDEQNNVVGAEPRDKTVREYVTGPSSWLLAYPRSAAGGFGAEAAMCSSLTGLARCT